MRILTESVMDVSYALDSVGNRTRKTLNGDSVDYAYDALNRLIEQSNGKPNQTQHYTYDRVGNRMTGPAKQDAYAYGDANMLLSDRHAQYVYDALGNLIEKRTGEGVVYFAYDAENRLSKVTMPDGKVIEYGYDPMGRRVRRTVNGASTYFVMADEDMIAEYEGSAVGNVYIHGPGTDEPWALVTRKGTYFYHADGLGSIVAITDASRRTVQEYEYDFFGGQGGGASFGGLHDMKNRIKQPYTFTGREFDRDTRLYYYRARYYDPSTGRFTQQDPIGYQGGLNLYAYVGGNPVNAVDPSGEVLVSLAEGMKIVQEARTWIGTPYQSPGMTRAGIDCSRLVWRVYNDLNYTYNYAYTGVFATRTEFKKVTAPQEGDVVLFSGHMGIYNNGKIINAQSGAGVVKIGEIHWFGDVLGYYRYDRNEGCY